MPVEVAAGLGMQVIIKPEQEPKELAVLAVAVRDQEYKRLAHLELFMQQLEAQISAAAAAAVVAVIQMAQQAVLVLLF